MKYYHNPQVGYTMGRILAKDLLLTSSFFESVDLLIPVPLHKKKERKRGYNQCHYLAKGIADLTGLPIDRKHLIRHRSTLSQTKQNGRLERQDNVEGSFSVIDSTPFQGKHILLIDDVMTTGATLIACAQAIEKAANGVSFSFLSLACGR